MPATKNDHRAAAARNNALWCDAIARAKFQPAQFHADFWVNDGACLPLYPSLVTLAADVSQDVMTAVSELPRGAAVKDSFAALDLGPLGFRTILAGTWLHRPAGAVSSKDAAAVATVIGTTGELGAWIDAWGGDEPRGRDNFQPSLLENQAIQFVSVQTDGVVSGGAVFNAGPEGVIGLSNLFGAGAENPATLAALIAGQANHQIVGYEVDDSVVSSYEHLGFSRIGDLRVWLRT